MTEFHRIPLISIDELSFYFSRLTIASLEVQSQTSGPAPSVCLWGSLYFDRGRSLVDKYGLVNFTGAICEMISVRRTVVACDVLPFKFCWSDSYCY